MRLEATAVTAARALRAEAVANRTQAAQILIDARERAARRAFDAEEVSSRRMADAMAQAEQARRKALDAGRARLEQLRESPCFDYLDDPALLPAIPTAVGPGTDAGPPASRADLLVLAGAFAAALAAGPLIFVGGLVAVGGLAALALFVAMIVRPQLVAYTMLATTPLIVGMERDSVLPLLRPSEAVLLLACGTLVLRRLWRLFAGEKLRLHVGRIDLALLALAVTSSIIPLLWMVARGLAPTVDDVLYALTLWKYYVLYLVVRASVRTVDQVRVCLWLSMAAGAAVAIIGLLQALQLFGVPELLSRYYVNLDGLDSLTRNRGTSTIASSIAVADVMTFNLAIAIGLLVRRTRQQGLLMALAALFVVGALASGQFSGAIALVVGGATAGFITGHLRRTALATIPAVIVAGGFLRPVFERRLSGFDSPDGLPPSWLARLDNLRTFFWPKLLDGFNYILGVQPSARVPAPETWREYVFIESGHTWLLWTGGIPLLLAFFAYLGVAVGATRIVATGRDDAVGAAAVAAFTSLVVIAVLMIFDPHLALRGSADLAFPLLALSLTMSGRGADSGRAGGLGLVTGRDVAEADGGEGDVASTAGSTGVHATGAGAGPVAHGWSTVAQRGVG